MRHFPRKTIILKLLRLLNIGEADLLFDAIYRRLWSSVLISSLGMQITLLALPLTAAVLLHASPKQMGLLTFMEILPFVLFSLPSGVWLDRVRKLPVYIIGEISIAIAVASVPLAWWLDSLSIEWLYFVSFIIGSVNTTSGSAAQIVLTQIVSRERLVEAFAKNALATSGSEITGPAIAGALFKIMGAPLALLSNALLLLASALILRGITIIENLNAATKPHFWRDLKEGLSFVAKKPLLVALAATVGLWQLSYNAALVVQILFASRVLGLSEQAIGLSYTGMGIGSIVASLFGHRISRAIGPGLSIIIGITVCGVGWSTLAIAPANGFGIAAFVLMLFCFAIGGVLIFINFLALRQAITPEPMLGRMTSTMRWLILLPAGPGALIGGWMGEHFGLRSSLGFAGVTALLLAFVTWRNSVVRNIKSLPSFAHSSPEIVT